MNKNTAVVYIVTTAVFCSNSFDVLNNDAANNAVSRKGEKIRLEKHCGKILTDMVLAGI